VVVAAIAREAVLHRLVGLTLIAAVLALAPAAHASPPDQTWIAGLYDNADFDDVVLFITSGIGAVQSSLLWSLRMVAFVVGLATLTDTEPRPLFSPSSDLSRAPPFAE